MGAIQIGSVVNNRLNINLENLRTILDGVGDRPVSVISVNGPMRSGKSYLINHFLRYLMAPNEDWFHKTLDAQFHWKSSSDRQTTGILAWFQPLIIQRGGREIAVILLDTQGCFDDQTSTVENSLIFAFSCLISSVLIYNFKNQLSEDILQFLQMFVGYSKMIADQEPSSHMWFAIRDWQCPVEFPFGFYDDSHSAGARNFKTEKFNAISEMTPQVQQTRREILSNFRRVGAYLFPYPGNELALYDKSDNLDSSFVNAIRDFVPRIFDDGNGIVKKIGDQKVTGNQLKHMVEIWSEVFSTAEIPTVGSVAQATAEMQNAAALSTALNHYRAEMNVVHHSDGLTEDALQGIHNCKQEGALTMFRQTKKLRHSEVEQRYGTMLFDSIQKEFLSLRDVNTVKRQFREMQIAQEEEKRRLAEEAQRQIAAAQQQQAHGGRRHHGGFLRKVVRLRF